MCVGIVWARLCRVGSLCPTYPSVLSWGTLHLKTLFWEALMPHCRVCSTHPCCENTALGGSNTPSTTNIFEVIPLFTHTAEYVPVSESFHKVFQRPMGPVHVTQVPSLFKCTSRGDSCYSSKWSLEKASSLAVMSQIIYEFIRQCTGCYFTLGIIRNLAVDHDCTIRSLCETRPDVSIRC